MKLKRNENKNVHIIVSHPKGNGTFNYRIKSFRDELNLGQYTVYIPYIIYPFETYFKGTSKDLDVLDSQSLVPVKPTLNWIQKAICFFQELGGHSLFFKVLYALNIVLYRIDVWYIPLYKSYCLNKRDNIIIATGGPGSVFRMAYELSQRNKSKLILDYRDPWNLGYNLLESGVLVSKLKKSIMLGEELNILKHANHIITVSESLKSFFPAEYQDKITVIENGSNFEQEEVKHKINAKPKKFSVVYVGTIYDDQLFDEDFFIAFSEFYKNSIDKQKVSLKFIGAARNRNLKNIIKKHGLDEITEITVRMGTEALKKHLVDASMFLQLRFKGRSKIISSKHADYLMFRKPILLPVSDEGDIAESITKFDVGYVCNGTTMTLQVLNKEYKRHLNAESIMLSDNDFAWLSRKELSKKLIKVISDL